MPWPKAGSVNHLHPDGSTAASAADSPEKQNCTFDKVRQRRRRCMHGCRAMADQQGFRGPHPVSSQQWHFISLPGP